MSVDAYIARRVTDHTYLEATAVLPATERSYFEGVQTVLRWIEFRQFAFTR